ncbi:GNAT family N-acetyltransferase [Methylobacterium sp. J-076]|uniref:GNAT family N-acetyltransferase n=1 Tax=Methylobacterium sp. J-076 TaxID=2836655 RepID=UPI001FB9F0C9|nr:GNAT family N-acetyltransferase [Methylobacterium sp. J-076]MCJ2015712.1 GNAT family N-acetyltransferase [Methylobacterium sp. J-076]
MNAPPIRFGRNLSSAGDIRLHLTECAPAFVPSLDSRVVIQDYAAKLALHAERFEAWHGAHLVGLVALYDGTSAGGEAFVSNVSVAPGFTRRGLARRLLADAIGHARGGCPAIALQVDRRAPALALYLSLGFTVAARDGDGLTLRLALAPQAHAHR